MNNDLKTEITNSTTKGLFELLGVEPGEFFYFTDRAGTVNKNFRYYITVYYDIMYVDLVTHENYPSAFSLSDIFRGTVTITKMPYKPKDGDIYWYYDTRNAIPTESVFSYDSTFSLLSYNIGNCFKTQAECARNADKIRHKYNDILRELK